MSLLQNAGLPPLSVLTKPPKKQRPRRVLVAPRPVDDDGAGCRPSASPASDDVTISTSSSTKTPVGRRRWTPIRPSLFPPSSSKPLSTFDNGSRGLRDLRSGATIVHSSVQTVNRVLITLPRDENDAKATTGSCQSVALSNNDEQIRRTASVSGAALSSSPPMSRPTSSPTSSNPLAYLDDKTQINHMKLPVISNSIFIVTKYHNYAAKDMTTSTTTQSKTAEGGDAAAPLDSRVSSSPSSPGSKSSSLPALPKSTTASSLPISASQSPTSTHQSPTSTLKSSTQSPISASQSSISESQSPTLATHSSTSAPRSPILSTKTIVNGRREFRCDFKGCGTLFTTNYNLEW